MAQVQCEFQEGSVRSPSEATPSEISHETLIATLPTRQGWSTQLILYKKFWIRLAALRSLMLAPDKFMPRHDDTILATHPKSGTTWLKALAFTIANRIATLLPITLSSHAFLRMLCHFLEVKPGGLEYVETMPSPRLISTHSPFSLLPPGVSSSGCRIVYLCREPKDSFVSRWHFERSIMSEVNPISIDDAFKMFYEGCTPYGPFWNHYLEYWKESLMRPKEVLFLRYDEIVSDPLEVVRRLASFLGVPFTEDEEKSGLVDQVVRFCSIESLRNLDVNKTGGIEHSGGKVVIEHSSFFRKGEVGDWVNHMNKEMAEKLDRLVEDKLRGSGLVRDH